MCLDTITKRHDPPDPTVRKAYKVFAPTFRKNGYLFLFQPFEGSSEVPVNQWLTTEIDSAPTLFSEDDGTYPAGFHVYVNKSDARRFAWPSEPIVEVKVRGVHTEGDQLGHVLVAREMFVPKPEEKQ